LAVKKLKEAAAAARKEAKVQAKQAKIDKKAAAAAAKANVPKKRKKRAKKCTSPVRKKKNANVHVSGAQERPDTPPRKKGTKKSKVRKDFRVGTRVAVVDVDHADGPVCWGSVVERQSNNPPTFILHFPDGNFDYTIDEIYTTADDALRAAYDSYGFCGGGAAGDTVMLRPFVV
jgi:hypothetical protein